MKMKLLFWMNVFMLHFGIAYYLKEKVNAEFTAIIDTPNKPKQMFLNQKIVNFKKTWYFHDHIKKIDTTPDLEYLSNFEKKYNIDLWKLAINERHFYKFNKFYKFSTNEILKFLEQECKLFEQVLEEAKPDYFLTYDPPFHHQKLLMDLCKAKGIKVLCIFISRYKDKSIIAEEGTTFDLPQNLESMKLKELEENEIDETINNSSYNVITKKWTNERNTSTSNKIKALTDYLLFSDSKNAQSNFTYYGRNKLKVIQDTIMFYMKREWRSNYLGKNLKKNVDLNVPFVYYPLNIDAELTILHYAPLFTDQMEIIQHISKSLPVDHVLYVKEHIHAVFRGWRETNQYKKLLEIPNVVLIHPSYSSKELIKNCKLVTTVRGTATIDAAYQNKPSIIFGDMAHGMLPSVYKVENLKDLPELIKTALNTPINPIHIKKYLKLMKDRSFEFNWWDYENKRNNQFYSGNILSDVEYQENQVKDFFQSNKEIFEPLVNAHIEKMDFN